MLVVTRYEKPTHVAQKQHLWQVSELTQIGMIAIKGHQSFDGTRHQASLQFGQERVPDVEDHDHALPVRATERLTRTRAGSMTSAVGYGMSASG